MSLPRGLGRLLLSGIALAVATAGPPGRWGAAVWEDELRPGRRVRVFELDVDRGDLTLVAGPVLRVRRAAPAWPSALDLRHGLDDGRLSMRARCLVPAGCPVAHVITVPEDTTARIRLGQGTLRAVGVAALDAQISLGDAIVSDPRRLRLAVGAGGVRLSARDPAAVEVHVSAGDIDAALPADTAALGLVGRAILLDGLSLRGDQPSDPALRLAAPGGSLRVVALQPARGPAPAPWSAPR